MALIIAVIVSRRDDHGHSAVKAALAREPQNTNWVKLEVVGDYETPYPNVSELIETTRRLADDSFVVLPYRNDEPVGVSVLSTRAPPP
jgi:thiazole synthase ThiGH ThiG subunit